ncbi:hypothetical protein GCM10023092_01440 [Rurimicrobium arvi]|uniref:Fungal lipase-type domain-containing protein n=2 Tax=Rurimicrobium arvi TaxID=2049916 RepID=A0ABP8MCX1_9BACT
MFSLAQTLPLRAGFDAGEYAELMYISARTGALSPDYYKHIPKPATHQLVYRSAPVGLDNLWELWGGPQQSAVISLRGTTAAALSWLANFYAGMVPANGSVQVSDSFRFDYRLAQHPRATVHVGWLLSLGFLSREILPRLDSCYRAGVRDLSIIGHSQGGALTYLLTAQLRMMQQSGAFAGMRIKSYASAGPKPGNLYFAYDYENLTRGGWAFNVVNAADWVPETPVSIQTIRDFNKTNPFAGAGSVIRKQKVPVRWALAHAYRRLDKSTRKAEKIYRRYLARTAGKIVRKSLQSFRTPVYETGMDYTRAGNYVVLMPDSAYYRRFPDSDTAVFVHHLHAPYLYLLSRYRP